MSSASPEEKDAARGAAPIIEMQGVAVGSGSVGATASIEGINWPVAAGDYWAIGGPPGSGKSDLLATMAGLFPPLSGSLRLFGNAVVDLTEEELVKARLRIGLVFESGGRLFNHLTVRENVALPLRYHRVLQPAETAEWVEKILEATCLTPLADCTPGQIKHLWRQRVGLARALSLRPEVLLLDNPLAGLGPQEARWWRDFLAQLSGESELMEGRRATLVVTCHDLRPWADQGAQFAVLSQKRWVRIGGRAELACSDEPLLRELLAADFWPRND